MSITCKQATDFISKNEEGKLTLLERYELWRHTAICSLCRLFYRQNKVITSVLADAEIHQDKHLNAAEKEAIIRHMHED